MPPTVTGSGTVTGSDGDGQRFAPVPICRAVPVAFLWRSADGHAPTVTPTGSGVPICRRVRAGTGSATVATVCRNRSDRRNRSPWRSADGHADRFGRATVPTGQPRRQFRRATVRGVPIFRRGDMATGSERSRVRRGDLPTVTGSDGDRFGNRSPSVSRRARFVSCAARMFHAARPCVPADGDRRNRSPSRSSDRVTGDNRPASDLPTGDSSG